MLEALVGNNVAVIPMLLLFISLLLSKRIVPWYVYEEVLNKLKKYEDAAPGLIEEINNLLQIVNLQHQVKPEGRQGEGETPMLPTNPKRRVISHKAKSPVRGREP